jgi:DNA-binding beta-propeller fold protein YncE
VLDAGNFRVQAFDRDGKFLRAWGKTGNDIGDFVRPRGIAVDNEGNVYVTDAAFGNVQIFSPKGELLLPVGYLGTEDRPGIFAMPGGVAVDETGHMYVVDQVFDKVDVFRRLSKEEGELIIRNSGK